MARARSTASVRKQLADAVAKHYGEEDIAKIIEAAKGSETSTAAECPECGHTMRVKIPDFKKQMDVLIALLEQSEGKAAQAMPEATTVIVERPAR